MFSKNNTMISCWRWLYSNIRKWKMQENLILILCFLNFYVVPSQCGIYTVAGVPVTDMAWLNWLYCNLSRQHQITMLHLHSHLSNMHMCCSIVPFLKTRLLVNKGVLMKGFPCFHWVEYDVHCALCIVHRPTKELVLPHIQPFRAGLLMLVLLVGPR